MKRKEVQERMTRAACGSVTLGQVENAGIESLRVECLCCPRKGRYNVAGLIARHGPQAQLERLKNAFAASCPGIRAASIYARCGVYYPELPKKKGRE